MATDTSKKPAGANPKKTKADKGKSPAASEGVSASKPSRGDTLISLMRAGGGATAQDMAAAVGWQVHSVRGFISGTVKKRADLSLSAARREGATYYSVTDGTEAQ